MKKVLFVVLLFITIVISGKTNDSLKIDDLQRDVSNLKSTVSRLQGEDCRLRGLYQQQAKELDSLLTQQARQAENVRILEEKTGVEISDANLKIDNNVSTLFDSINSRSWLGAFGLLIAIGLLACAYFALNRKIRNGVSTIDKIRSAQKAMQEESVKLDNKLVGLLDKQLNQSPEPKQDHSFVLGIANEIARIEQNLAFMDTKVKGVSNLKNRVSAINDRLKSKGYEIPSLVGEKYAEGSNMKPTMELDEDLPVGIQIIRRVLKPMVLYKGEMIQAAEVVVAYNE